MQEVVDLVASLPTHYIERIRERMGRSTYVRFGADKKPTRDEIQIVLEDYLGMAAVEITRHDEGSWSCVLPGKPRAPLNRIVGAYPHLTFEDNERFFEAQLIEGKELVITTRGADEFTNAIASRFAEICARFWQGELQRPD